MQHQRSFSESLHSLYKSLELNEKLTYMMKLEENKQHISSPPLRLCVCERECVSVVS